MASNTDFVKKLYYNMSVLCLYLCVCMSVSLQSSKLNLQTSQNCWWWCTERCTDAASLVYVFISCIYVSYIYTVSQKPRHLTLAHNFTKYWPIFKIFFTVRLNRKCVTNSCTNTPPHPKRVATLPCEISVFKKSRHS